MIGFLFFSFFSLLILTFYFFGREKFSLGYLLIAVWLASIGVSQWRLSRLEENWNLKFWLILFLFFIIFWLVKIYCDYFWPKKIAPTDSSWQFNSRRFGWLIFILMSFACAANLYIFSRFGTLPILSTIPDRMRFIINQEVFGVWEYLALLPRILIPVIFIYWWRLGNKFSLPALASLASIFFGFSLLALYASRVVMILAILMGYFSYLALNLKKINWRRIFTASLAVLIVVLVLSVAIPTIRQYLTYRDYESDLDYQPFTYLFDLAELEIDERLAWVVPLYIIPSFNLQAMMRSIDYFQWPDFYFGQYTLSVFNPALKIFGLPLFDSVISWKEIFLPWWVTGTMLFNYWVDFGLIGIFLAAVFWAALLSFIYHWSRLRPSLITILLFSYFSFVVIMTIYTNYFMRPELYLDLLLIIFLGWFLIKKENRRKNPVKDCN